MTVPDTYIHGTEPGEQQRLAALNRLTNRAFVEFLARLRFQVGYKT